MTALNAQNTTTAAAPGTAIAGVRITRLDVNSYAEADIYAGYVDRNKEVYWRNELESVGGQVLIGRAPAYRGVGDSSARTLADNSWVHPSPVLSREHAKLRIEPDRVIIDDAHSHHGLWYNANHAIPDAPERLVRIPAGNGGSLGVWDGAVFTLGKQVEKHGKMYNPARVRIDFVYGEPLYPQLQPAAPNATPTSQETSFSSQTMSSATTTPLASNQSSLTITTTTSASPPNRFGINAWEDEDGDGEPYDSSESTSDFSDIDRGYGLPALHSGRSRSRYDRYPHDGYSAQGPPSALPRTTDGLRDLAREVFGSDTDSEDEAEAASPPPWKAAFEKSRPNDEDEHESEDEDEEPEEYSSKEEDVAAFPRGPLGQSSIHSVIEALPPWRRPSGYGLPPFMEDLDDDMDLSGADEPDDDDIDDEVPEVDEFECIYDPEPICVPEVAVGPLTVCTLGSAPFGDAKYLSSIEKDIEEDLAGSGVHTRFDDNAQPQAPGTHTRFVGADGGYSPKECTYPDNFEPESPELFSPIYSPPLGQAPVRSTTPPYAPSKPFYLHMPTPHNPTALSSLIHLGEISPPVSSQEDSDSSSDAESVVEVKRLDKGKGKLVDVGPHFKPNLLAGASSRDPIVLDLDLSQNSQLLRPLPLSQGSTGSSVQAPIFVGSDSESASDSEDMDSDAEEDVHRGPFIEHGVDEDSDDSYSSGESNESEVEYTRGAARTERMMRGIFGGDSDNDGEETSDMDSDVAPKSASPFHVRLPPIAPTPAWASLPTDSAAITLPPVVGLLPHSFSHPLSLPQALPPPPPFVPSPKVDLSFYQYPLCSVTTTADIARAAQEAGLPPNPNSSLAGPMWGSSLEPRQAPSWLAVEQQVPASVTDEPTAPVDTGLTIPATELPTMERTQPPAPVMASVQAVPMSVPCTVAPEEPAEDEPETRIERHEHMSEDPLHPNWDFEHCVKDAIEAIASAVEGESIDTGANQEIPAPPAPAAESDTESTMMPINDIDTVIQRVMEVASTTTEVQNSTGILAAKPTLKRPFPESDDTTEEVNTSVPDDSTRITPHFALPRAQQQHPSRDREISPLPTTRARRFSAASGSDLSAHDEELKTPPVQHLNIEPEPLVVHDGMDLDDTQRPVDIQSIADVEDEERPRKRARLSPSSSNLRGFITGAVAGSVLTWAGLAFF